MPNAPLVLAIDQGTTNTKAILVNREGSVVAQAAQPMDIEYPLPGWAQQDAATIWTAVREAMQSSAAGSLSVLMADGGVTRNEQLMQFQADILCVPVQRNDTAELSAMGAARTTLHP